MEKIKYIANVVRWFDKVNGNTYHSVNVTRVEDGEKLYCAFRYGYDEAYRDTALKAMADNGWLKGYTGEFNSYYKYERENNYPIMWNVRDGLKRECVANGIKGGK